MVAQAPGQMMFFCPQLHDHMIHTVQNLLGVHNFFKKIIACWFWGSRPLQPKNSTDHWGSVSNKSLCFEPEIWLSRSFFKCWISKTFRADDLRPFIPTAHPKPPDFFTFHQLKGAQKIWTMSSDKQKQRIDNAYCGTGSGFMDDDFVSAVQYNVQYTVYAKLSHFGVWRLSHSQNDPGNLRNWNEPYFDFWWILDDFWAYEAEGCKATSWWLEDGVIVGRQRLSVCLVYRHPNISKFVATYTCYTSNNPTIIRVTKDRVQKRMNDRSPPPNLGGSKGDLFIPWVYHVYICWWFCILDGSR